VWLSCVAVAQQVAPTRLVGRVEAADGSPVPAAIVEVASPAWPERILRRQRSDGEGVFFLALPEAQPRLLVRAYGHDTAIATAIVRDSRQPIVLQVAPSVTVRGVLRDSRGSPVAGTRVRGLGFSPRRWGDSYATTDRDGRFVMENLPFGAISIVASVPGEGMFWHNRHADGDAEVELLRSDGDRTTIAIEVAGLPPEVAPQVRVELRPNASFNGLPPPWDDVHLAADGTLRLTDLPNVRYVVGLHADGFRFEPREVRFEPHDVQRTIQLRAVELPPEQRQVPVQLSDQNGLPLEGVPLRLSGLEVGLVAEAITDAAGGACFDAALPAGTAILVESLDPRWALAQDRMPPAEPRIWNAMRCALPEVQAGARRPAIPLQAVAATSVEVQVQLPDGTPAAQLPVWIEGAQQEDFSWFVAWSRFTDGRGRLRLEGLRPDFGVWRVRVADVRGIGCSGPLDLTGSKPPERLRLSPTATLRGVVLDSGGRPLGGRRIDVEDGAKDPAWKRTLLTDAQGRFAVSAVAAGMVRYSDDTGAAIGQQVLLRANEVVEVRIVVAAGR
jgi:hypothetical protein